MTDTDSPGSAQSPGRTELSVGTARDLLVDLVETPSPSGEEGACADRVVEFFETYNRDAWIDDMGNVRAPGNDALLVTSHLDTVPGNIPVHQEDGALWGRGAVDAKGALAAMAVTAVRTGVSFAGVVGEEVDSRGARHLVADRAAPRAIVNGEPSGWNGITLGYRGLLGGTYVSTSESGHTSRPDPNAIQHAIRWWSRVEAAFERDEWESVFEQVTAKPVSFNGGTDEDGLAVDATLDVQLRVPPQMTVDAVRERADGELADGTVNWWDEVPPVVASPRTPIARAFRGAIRHMNGDPRLLRKTGTSDMNVFADTWDVPIVTYGPGDSALDHAPNEHLPFEEFENALAVLTRAAERIRDREASDG